MNILVACEESQAVCAAFRAKGHTAWSCDIIDQSGGHPEWHIQGDVIPLLGGNCNFVTNDTQTHYQDGHWDMIIAFPPCTHLASSGARWFEAKRKDGRQREGIEFFAKFLNAPCDKVVIENPIGIIAGEYIPTYFPDLAEKYNFPRKPSQIIHPWQFGDNYEKSTCLWIKGVDNLVPKVEKKPELDYFEWTDKNGKKKRQPKWYAEALNLPADERAKVRSKTFPSIAQAMADQWG